MSLASAKPVEREHRDRLQERGAPTSLLALADVGSLLTVDAPMFSDKRQTFMARYSDVEPLMRPLDGTWYSGVKPWSLAIRVGCCSVASHGGLVLDDPSGAANNIDVCEMVGCRERPFRDLVKAEHGQSLWKGSWYWGPMDDWFRHSIDTNKGIDAAREYIGCKYGHLAIVYEAMWHMPIFRELAFLHAYKDVQSERKWTDRTPYCSMFQTIVVQKSGRDPVPGRALQLTSPQDTWQSLAWPMKVLLVP